MPLTSRHECYCHIGPYVFDIYIRIKRKSVREAPPGAYSLAQICKQGFINRLTYFGVFLVLCSELHSSVVMCPSVARGRARARLLPRSSAEVGR